MTDLDLRLARRAAGSGDELSAILSLVNAPGLITFSGGFPAHEIFPVEFVRDLATGQLASGAQVALQYTPTEGLASFRAALADWLLASQGVAPEALMVTSGGIEALQLICRTLLDPGDRVLVESPTYVGALTAFSGFEARIDAVAADSDGIDPDALAAALAAGPPPKLLYVIPDFQNPTGAWLTTERRHALVDLARQHGLLVVEDVAYRELGFTGEQRPSLWSLAPDVVVQVGTFSKILFPGVRLGWAAGPPALIPHLVRAKQNSDQCAGGFGQWLAESLLRGDRLEPQLALARATYAQRWAAMSAGLSKHLGPEFSWSEPGGGFFTWVTGPRDLDTTALLPRARDLGVAFVPGAPFHAARTASSVAGDRDRHHTLRLAFSATTPDEIAEGTRRLGLLLTGAAS
ncbi:aminotransferase-like domain-containing protein [Asanoa siamensis]|uniref:2-aminoadipate aminotransferase n=1 Tax=Asanoa siamensis TaxID=926357 RepID=A0ABQ4D051_9ACTN|nr:PLP-dependent aminotransferase family protein [Asanoa siamensis]GIF76924.1 2-aminoadipate aminotransferase [Asanoa siamensis]